MALADGSWVTPKTILGTAGATLLDGSPWLAQPPHVGVLSGFTAGPPDNADILWDNGEFDANVDVTATTGSVVQLDVPSAGSISSFSGQVVRRIANNQSGAYIGVPVLIASMFLADDDEAATDFVVVKTLGPARSYWVALASDIEVVAGR